MYKRQVLGTWEKGRACKDVVFRYELMQEELGTAADAVVDDSIIDTPVSYTHLS